MSSPARGRSLLDRLPARLILALVLGSFVGHPSATGQQRRPVRPLVLETRRIPGTDLEVREGFHRVHENREAGTGRTIDLHVVVLPATGPDRAPDPIFFLAGGPGQAATAHARAVASSWMRRRRDIVLVDQRGTGRSHPLRCNLSGSDEDLQGYLDPIFQIDRFQACLERLRTIADLRLYTTPVAMDDLDEIREALGYGRVNLMGGSYGTRAALVYMRRHPESVRAAVLNGVAPIAFRNPLYHAREAQRALDLLLDACASDPACREAFPELGAEVQAVLERLEAKPAKVTVSHPRTGGVTVRLSREAFGEALRVMMYHGDSAARVPRVLHEAFLGDLRPFAELGIATNRALRDQLAFGMLLCVTCSEDIARIDPEEVLPLTEGTFVGAGRVLRQMGVCGIWPRGMVPEGYGEPVRCEVPTLLLSGTLDPVTPPRWGEEAAAHLARSLHVVAPGFHGVSGPCIESIVDAFLESGSVEGLDTSCVQEMRLPRFESRAGR